MAIATVGFAAACLFVVAHAMQLEDIARHGADTAQQQMGFQGGQLGRGAYPRYDLAGDITPAAWDRMPSCGYYKNRPGS